MIVSVVIPVFNEEESLRPLYAEIAEVARREGLTLDVLFVDDGSRDGSWRIIADLAAADPSVRGIRLRRNFGKAAALSAGFRAARGELILTLDADLQDDPAEIPRFLAALAHGTEGGSPRAPGSPAEDRLDVVSGWKRVRLDPWHKVLPSRVFNRMVGWLTGVWLHDHNCGMKAYRREVFNEVHIYGELHRFIPVLAAAQGFRVGEIAINHRPRKFGRSKYGVWRFIKGFLDLLTVKFLTGFGHRPQHLLGSLGLLSFATGGLVLTYLAVTWLINNIFYAGLDPTERPFLPLHERPLLIYALGAFLLGAQMISIGLIAEMIAYQGRQEDRYSIAETAGGREGEKGGVP